VRYLNKLLVPILFSATLIAQPQPQTEPKEISDLRNAAEQGDAKKQWALGDKYYTGESVPKDHAEAMKWYRKAAEHGDANKQEQLGFMLSISGDSVEAAKWYRRAAEQGNLLSQSSLAGMYSEGKGVPQNYAEAAKWYRQAAENAASDGQPPLKPRAASSLAALYEKGLGVAQDFAEAAKWYRKAVETGNDTAAFSLYFLCRAGKSTVQECADVAKWLSILANQDDNLLSPSVRSYRGSNVSQFYLGTLFENGWGVPQDYVEAAQWYRKAADQGNVGAQSALGMLYLLGKGVPQDIVLAHMWVNLSVSKSPAELQRAGAELRDQISAQMTAAQIAEAQRLAREWKPTMAK